MLIHKNDDRKKDAKSKNVNNQMNVKIRYRGKESCLARKHCDELE